MLIKGFRKLSLIEYPGKLSAVIWVGGCNFRCPFCYNKDIVLNYKKTPTVPEKEVINFMFRRKGLLDGLAITGGEPTLQKDLPEFAEKVKATGSLVMIETNGSNPKMIKELIDKGLVDYIAMDIKAPLDEYEKAAGVKVNEKDIKRTIDIIRESGVEYEFRTTVVPKLFDRRGALKIGKWLKGSKRYCIQQFKSEKTLDKAFEKIRPYSPDKLKEFADLMKPFFGSVKVRGTKQYSTVTSP